MSSSTSVISTKHQSHLNLTNDLFRAADKGDNDKIKELFHQKVNVNAIDSLSQTPLMRASKLQQAHSVKLLIDLGASIDFQANNGMTALFFSVYYKNYICMKILLKEGANPDLATSNLWTPLIAAVDLNQADYLSALIEARANINLQRDDGMTALMIAAEKDHLTSLSQLLENGAILELKNHKGDTALICAVKAKSSRCLKALISKGACVDAKDSQGNTALMVAASLGDVESFDALALQHELNELKKLNGNKILKALTGTFITSWINRTNNDDNTALMISAQNGHLSIVKKLLEKSAKVNKINSNRKQALDIAKPNCKEILEAHGAKIYHQRGGSPLTMGETEF